MSKGTEKNTLCAKCGMCPCICISWCPSAQLGCCNQENSSKNCAGPVHLTAQFDIGSRPCCVGEKYTAMGGLLNYCSTNGGKELPLGTKFVAPYPMGNYADVIVPKHNPIPDPANPATWIKPVPKSVPQHSNHTRKCVPPVKKYVQPSKGMAAGIF